MSTPVAAPSSGSGCSSIINNKSNHNVNANDSGLPASSSSSSSSSSASASAAADEERRYEHACKIWYQIPGGKAAREFYAMSSQEREQVWADLTGHDLLSHASQRLQQYSKTREQVQALLQELHQRVLQHSVQDALALALQSSPTYVYQQYPKFLATQEWKVEGAYEMMQAHFQIKYDLFGKELLGRDVLLNDLDRETLKCLQGGGYQYSYDSQDRAGRAFSFLNLSFMSHERYSKEQILRGLFYQNQCLSSNESVQRLGCVRLCYFDPTMYPQDGPDYEFLRTCTKVLYAMPVRTVAFYLVVTATDSPWMKATELIVLLVNKFLRARTRIVHGSFVENMYTLMCLGLPADYIPVDRSGYPKTDQLLKWLRQRHVVEMQQQQQTQQAT